MDDLISRQAAIERFDCIRPCDPMTSDYTHGIDVGIALCKVAIREQPPAQLGTNLASLGTDCISRQKAINALYEWECDNKDDRDAIDVINGLPPIQPVNCSEFPNNSDVVDRQKAKNAICNACGKIDCDEMDTCEKLDIPSEGSKLLQPWEVLVAQAVLPQSAEPKRGKWIDTRGNAEWYAREYECSECGDTMLGEANFCPNCGAKMEGADDE